MLTDRDVVRDLNEIIDFGALFDDRVLSRHRCTINRDIGTQLNVIFDDHPAELRDFAMHALVLDVTKPITPDDGAAMDDHPGSDSAPVTNSDVRIEHCVVSDRRIIPHKNPGIECDGETDSDAVTE